MAAPSLALLAGFLLAAAPGEPPRPSPPDPAAPLLEADRAFDAAVGRRDREAFLALVGPEAVFVGSALLVGRDAVWERWSRFFDPAGPTLRWHPTGGGVAASGDLGWTVGEARYAWASKGVSEDGLRYLTVWRKGPDGRWAAVMDGSLEPVAAEPSERTPALTLTSRDGKLEAEIGTFVRGEGSGRRTGAYLVVREQRGGAWQVVRESEIRLSPAP